MKKVIMGIGVPGSGKTTILKTFAEKNNYSYICPDDIRFELTGDHSNQTKNKEVWKIAYDRVGKELQSGNTVVFDATFVNEKQRKDFISYIKEEGAEKVQGVFLDVPIKIAKERNASRERVVPEYVMDRMHKMLQEFSPEIRDGFDSLFVLDESGDLCEAKMNFEDRVINHHFKIK